MLLTLSGRGFIKIQYSSFTLFPVAYPFRIATQIQYYVKREKCKVNDVKFSSGCGARAINLDNKNMKIGGAFNNASVSSALKSFHSERGRPLRRSIAPASTVDRRFACISKMASGSGHINLFPKRRKSLQTTILNLMKMAEKFSKRLENMMGRYEQFLLFPTEFSKDLYKERF